MKGNSRDKQRIEVPGLRLHMVRAARFVAGGSTAVEGVARTGRAVTNLRYQEPSETAAPSGHLNFAFLELALKLNLNLVAYRGDRPRLSRNRRFLGNVVRQ